MREFKEEEIRKYADDYVADADSFDGESDVYKSIQILGDEKAKTLMRDFLLYVLIEENFTVVENK